jgi:hypothetical protein
MCPNQSEISQAKIFKLDTKQASILAHSHLTQPQLDFPT